MVFLLHVYNRRFLAITFALILLTLTTHVEAARRPSRVPVRSSTSSSSSSSVRATTRPSRRTLMNGTSSSSAAAKVNSTYPINLMTNQEWKIRISSQFGNSTTVIQLNTDEQYVFDVSRKGESFSILEQDRNLKTGKLERSVTEWQARFNTAYYSPSDVYLELYHCWYQYPNIMEGFSCEYHRVPAQINQAAVQGDWDFDSLIESATRDYTVDILNKSSKDVACNVKAETTDDGSKIYYTKDSSFFGQINGKFQCFETEDSAKKAGYKQSYR